MTEPNQQNKNITCEEYIIQNNKDMTEKLKELQENIIDLKNEKEVLEEDNERMEKRLPYLRGLAINEYEACLMNYEIVKLMIGERNKLIRDTNNHIFIKSLIFVIVLTSAPAAWLINIYMSINVFAYYLISNSIIALCYFIFLPNFTFEKIKKYELPDSVKIKLKIYKDYRKNNNYLEDLINNY